MSGIGPVGYRFEEGSPGTSGSRSIPVTEHPCTEGQPPRRAVGYGHAFVDAAKDLPDGVVAGEGPASGNGDRCPVVSKAVERGVRSRRWTTRPRVNERRAERES